MAAMTSMSLRASPGGSAPRQCHCSQRPELVREPSSSAKQLEGRRKTSVLIFDGSTSLNSFTGRQKEAVSVDRGSMVTRYLSFDRPSVSLALSGTDARGLKPWQKYPFILPWYMSAK